MMWPEYPYQAMKTDPYSLMSRERDRLFFVTCGSEQEIEEAAALSLRGPLKSPLCVYRDGKPLKVVR